MSSNPAHRQQRISKLMQKIIEEPNQDADKLKNRFAATQGVTKNKTKEYLQILADAGYVEISKENGKNLVEPTSDGVKQFSETE